MVLFEELPLDNNGLHSYFILMKIKKGVEVNPVIQIRFEEVEQLFHETSTFSEKDSKGTSTIGCSIENYLGNNADTFRRESVYFSGRIYGNLRGQRDFRGCLV